MSNILPIDESIVPARVTKGYLKNYTQEQQRAIAGLYEKIEAEALEKLSGSLKSSVPLFMLVAGSQGVGKSKLVERLQSDYSEAFVECDVDSILQKMPEVRDAMADADREVMEYFNEATGYDADAHRTKLDAAVETYRPAAKYISDRLMSSCVARGINVIVETNAKTPHIKDFLDSVKNQGVQLIGHICEAPMGVKAAGAKSKQHGFSFPSDVLAAENDAFRKNIPVIAQACDNLTLWWRQDVDARLEAAAVATEHTYVTDILAKTGFDAYFADRPESISVKSLMDYRRDCTSKQKNEPRDHFIVAI